MQMKTKRKILTCFGTQLYNQVFFSFLILNYVYFTSLEHLKLITFNLGNILMSWFSYIQLPNNQLSCSFRAVRTFLDGEWVLSQHGN